MLVLSRRVNESIVIDGNIHVEVLRVSGGQIKIGIFAPADVTVKRGELLAEEQQEPASTPARATEEVAA